MRTNESVHASPCRSHAADDASEFLLNRLDRPTPRIALGHALADIAHACIDISDGLLADVAHIARASGVGIEIDVDALPASPVLIRTFDAATRRRLQATGGDDYELCFTAPPGAAQAIHDAARSAGVEVTRIGRVIDGPATVRAIDADGMEWRPAAQGYVHFGA